MSWLRECLETLDLHDIPDYDLYFNDEEISWHKYKDGYSSDSNDSDLFSEYMNDIYPTFDYRWYRNMYRRISDDDDDDDFDDYLYGEYDNSRLCTVCNQEKTFDGKTCEVCQKRKQTKRRKCMQCKKQVLAIDTNTKLCIKCHRNYKWKK